MKQEIEDALAELRLAYLEMLEISEKETAYKLLKIKAQKRLSIAKDAVRDIMI
jgi:hypothetical protein